MDWATTGVGVVRITLAHHMLRPSMALTPSARLMICALIDTDINAVATQRSCEEWHLPQRPQSTVRRIASLQLGSSLQTPAIAHSITHATASCSRRVVILAKADIPVRADSAGHGRNGNWQITSKDVTSRGTGRSSSHLFKRPGSSAWWAWKSVRKSTD